ncbi:putative acyltransferase [Flavihumibacter petaseus NBRC 106054]|uniref:Putative acyltransferase n=1 Tax=Flavihumibacter petaseus NBRC 106054 TaxID=1220578 RepID=A0A0E9N243_9BACT|nr:putative acyltransferase [Flavihumibacter petaseus NBRC 106054]
MRESATSFQVEAEVLGKREEFPERRKAIPFAEKGKGEIEHNRNQEKRNDPEKPLPEKHPERDDFTGFDLGEKLGGDQKTAQYEEQVNTRPHEAGEIG